MSLWSTTSAFAKDTWLPSYNYELENSQGSLLQLLGIDYNAPVGLEGRKWYMKVQIGDDLGFSALTQGGDFGTPGDIASDEATLELMRFNSTITFDGHEMGLLDSLSAAAAPIMQKKMAAAKSRVLREIERISIMDGTGALAKVASVSTPDITLDVAGAEYEERNAYTWIDDAYRSRYRAVDPTTGADSLTTPDSFQVTAINETTNVITTDTTTTGLSAGDLIVTDYGETAWASGGAFRSLEFDGLLAMIDDGNTYLNIDRTAAGKGYWKAVVDDNSGTNRDFTEARAHSILNKLARRSDDGVVNKRDHCGLASPGVWTAYHNLMSTGIRYSISETPDVGWGGREMLLMNGIPLYKHIHAPRNMVLIVHKPTTKYVTAKHGEKGIFSFIDRGGSIFFQGNASSGGGHADKVYAYIVGWLGMYSEKPRNNAKLDDLTEVSGAY